MSDLIKMLGSLAESGVVTIATLLAVAAAVVFYRLYQQERGYNRDLVIELRQLQREHIESTGKLLAEWRALREIWRRADV